MLLHQPVDDGALPTTAGSTHDDHFSFIHIIKEMLN